MLINCQLKDSEYMFKTTKLIMQYTVSPITDLSWVNMCSNVPSNTYLYLPYWTKLTQMCWVQDWSAWQLVQWAVTAEL